MDLCFVLLVVLLVVLVAVAVGLKKRRKREYIPYYPFSPSQWFSRRARLRREGLDLQVNDMKQPVPFARFLFGVTLVWLIVDVPFWALNGAFDFPVNNLVVLVIYIVLNVIFLVVIFFYGWANHNWSVTTKVQVGSGDNCTDLFTAKNWKPGANLGTVELPKSKNPTDGVEKIPVELILCGGVDNLPAHLPPQNGPVIIAQATFKGADGKMVAGRLDGKIYKIPCVPLAYVGGDMENWRGGDYFQLARDHYGKRVNIWTRFIVAMDVIEEKVDRNPPSGEPLRKELYQTKQRVIQVESDLEHYTGTDTGIKETLEEHGEE